MGLRWANGAIYVSYWGFWLSFLVLFFFIVIFCVSWVRGHGCLRWVYVAHDFLIRRVRPCGIGLLIYF